MKRIITIISFLSLIFSSKAYVIEGTVVSENDSRPLSDAICNLYRDGELISTEKTSPSGYFSLNVNESGQILLEIEKENYTAAEIILYGTKGNRNLGIIPLSEGVTLDEVTVTANPVQHIKGNTIIYPSEYEVKASSDILSMLSKMALPGLEANENTRTIQVYGGSPVLLINGIPSSITEVNAIKPKDILKVEYSSTEPGRYADQGYSGYLNIILKTREDGGSIYLWARSGVNTPSVDGQFSFSYHKGFSNFSLNYVPNWKNNNEVYDTMDQSYLSPDININLRSEGRVPFNYIYQTISAKYDYAPNLHTLFSATFNLQPNNSKSRSLLKEFENNENEYLINKHTTKKDFSPSLDLFFRRDFNDKNSLQVQLVGTLNKFKYRGLYSYIYSDDFTEEYPVDNIDGLRESLITEVNYQHNFSNKTTLEMGVQNTLSYNRFNYIFEDYNVYKRENNNYAYITYLQQIGRVFIELSTGLKVFFVETGDDKRTFIKNLSSARLSWNVSDRVNISGNFSYMPIIPTLGLLTDKPQQLSPYLISNGNPELLGPESYRTSLQFAYNYKKLSMTLRGEYNDIRNPYFFDVRYIGDNIFYQQGTNGKLSSNYGANLTLGLNNIKGLGFSGELQFSHYDSKNRDWSKSMSTIGGYFNVYWLFYIAQKPFMLSYSRGFPKKTLDGYAETIRSSYDGISLKFQFHDHWMIEAAWWYVLASHGDKFKVKSDSPVNPYYQERVFKGQGNMVTLALTYATDFGTLFNAAKRKLNNKDSGVDLNNN